MLGGVSSARGQWCGFASGTVASRCFGHGGANARVGHRDMQTLLDDVTLSLPRWRETTNHTCQRLPHNGRDGAENSVQRISCVKSIDGGSGVLGSGGLARAHIAHPLPSRGRYIDVFGKLRGDSSDTVAKRGLRTAATACIGEAVKALVNVFRQWPQVRGANQCILYQFSNSSCT